MKLLIRILFLLAPLAVFGQNNNIQNMATLASRYYQDKQMDKAADLYLQLYNATQAEAYFTNFIECAMAIPDYERAEKEIKKGLRGSANDVYWYIQLGYVKKAMGDTEESAKMYEKALSSVPSGLSEYQSLASQFISRREYAYAEKAYLTFRAKTNPEQFCYELGHVYYYMRNYDKMMAEYLTWARQSEGNLDIIKANLQSLLSTDTDQEISGQLRNFLLKRIQQEPNDLNNSRMLIWILSQDKNFPAAIRQAIALDKRTGSDEKNIIELADVAATNKFYDDAARAYEYLTSKGEKSAYFLLAHREVMLMQYQRFLEEGAMNREKALQLQEKFDQTFRIVGMVPETTSLLAQYAHLLAFYLDKPADALKLLNDAIAIPRQNQVQLVELKTELADVSVYAGDLWDAVLTYSQVIEGNKNASLADDVKFKKARLGYYMGNYQWAKAQLDALRASTSKLIANDALELSFFINENMDDDSTAAPLRIFARADLQMFRNNYAGTLAALDSITKLFPYNSLEDDVNFRKAAIYQKQSKYAEAAEALEAVLSNNSADMLADDALFQLAGLYEKQLNQKEKAMELYKKMMTDYPGSIYVVDSRTVYRKLQESTKTNAKPDSDKTKEEQFIEGNFPNP